MVKPKAGYRFIPVNCRMVEPPLKFKEISHARPLPEGYCGSIDVTWTAETPICVGGAQPENAGGNEVVTPFKLGDKYALPGASLRGMLRSIVEIVTFSHLGQINSHHHFGYRDFKDEYRKIVPPNEIKAGWIIYCEGDRCWEFAPAGNITDKQRGFHYLDISDIEKELDQKDWKIKDISEKYNELSTWNTGPDSKVLFNSSYEEDKFKYIVHEFSQYNTDTSGMTGYVICSGKANSPTSNKRYEAIFEQPDDGAWVRLSPETMEKFSFINSKQVKNGLEPEGSWQYWLEVSQWPEPKGGKPVPSKQEQGTFDLPGIPVYYVGDPSGSSSNFFMGLSRAIKAPYTYSVGEAAARTQGQDPPYTVPRLEENLDFARAIFGDVEGALDRAQGPDRMALKGRVAFGFARSENADLDQNIKEGVFMGPRASYWPFYLKNKDNPSRSASYNCGRAILAGRKRYPVRTETQSFIGGTDNVVSRIKFLKREAEFQGCIRFHNLRPVELGALLWALLLPGRGGKCRHALGRAKGFGYGRLRCEITELKARCNKGDKVLKESQYFIDEFEEYMNEKLGKPLQETAQVRALLAMSDPALGEERRRGLTYLPEPQAFQNIKKVETTLPHDYCESEDWTESRDCEDPPAPS